MRLNKWISILLALCLLLAALPAALAEQEEPDIAPGEEVLIEAAVEELATAAVPEDAEVGEAEDLIIDAGAPGVVTAESVAEPTADEPAAGEAAAADKSVAINETNFPDASFRRYLQEQFGADTITEAQINATTEFNVYDNTVASLKGIELFPKLQTLNCEDNCLTSLDLSGNPELTELNCGYNLLTGLDLSANPKLTSLYCYGNMLKTLNVSKCAALQTLNCSSNNLTELDLSGCEKLESLYCGSNKLARLDASKCTALTDLECNSNQLTQLDVSSCAKLSSLSCSGNKLASLDVAGKAELGYLSCGSNKLTSLKVTGCSKLTELSCSSNRLTALDLTGDAKLTNINCGDNELTTLDLAAVDPNLQLAVTEGRVSEGWFTDTVEIGASGYTVECDSDIELTIKDKVVRARNVKSIEFDTEADYKGNLYLCTGAKYQLKVVAEPASVKPVLTYEVERGDCVTVSGTGLVTCVKAGKATVTVTSDNGKSDSVKIVVTDPDFSIGSYSANMGVGESQTVAVDVTPASVASSLIWASSDAAVAEAAAGGVITANSIGTATITVTGGSVSKSFEITVKAAPKKVTLYKGSKAQKNGKTLTLKKGKTLKLKTKLTKNSASKLTWTSSKKSVATVDANGKVTAKKKGTTTITVRTFNGKKAYIKIKVK